MKRKIWLAPLSLVSLTVPAVLAASCGNGANENNKDLNQELLKNVKSAADLFNVNNFNNKPNNVTIDFPDHDAKLGVVTLNSTGDYTESSFDNDPTNDYGSYQSRIFQNAVGYLVRKQNLFQPIIETKKNGFSKIEYVIKRPTVWKYKLGYVSKVIVTKSDGSVEEFDNDFVDSFPDYDDKVNKSFNNLRYQAIAKENSTNPLAQKSINGERFFKALKGAKKIQFGIRKGFKWVDSAGKETKYEVVPEDFYLSYVRTYLLNKGYRETLLKKALPTIVIDSDAFEAFDAEANSFLSNGSREFTKDRKYPNAYLWDLYGFDGDSFLDESKFITDYNGEKVLTFNSSGKGDSKGDLLFDSLATVIDLVAFPSQYVSDNWNNPKFKNLSSKPQAELDKFLDKVKQIPKDSLISRTGTYWYGTDPYNLLFAGSYYYAGYDQSTQKESWKINKHFWDQEFVNGNTVKQIDKRYQNSTDETQFYSQNFNDYKIGKSYSLKYDNLSDDQRDELNKNPSKYGVNYYKSSNWSELSSTLQYRMLPSNVNQSPGVDLNFNEPFAKFFYGANASLSNLGNLKGKTDYENLISGYGLSFRTILTAAYNWESSASFVSENKKYAWKANAAPGGLINGKDSLGNNSNTVSDYEKQLNTLWALDKDLNKVDFGSGKTEISSEDNVKTASSESSDASKLKAANYAQLQKAMTALIDDFYAKNPSYDPSKDSDKLSFGYVWRWGNWNAGKNYQTLWQNGFIKKIIEELDSKGRLKVNMKQYDIKTQSNNWKESFAAPKGNSIFTFTGWAYDYNGIGSGLDGIVSRQITPQLLLIGQSTELQNKLNPVFPNLVKAAKALVAFIEKGVADGKFTLSVPLNRIFDAPSSTLAMIYFNFQNWKIDASNNIVEDSVEHGTELSLINSFFWLYYSTTELTNQENIDLVQELAVFSGPIVDSGRIYSRDFSPVISNPHFRSPFSGVEQNWYEDIRIWQ